MDVKCTLTLVAGTGRIVSLTLAMSNITLNSSPTRVLPTPTGTTTVSNTDSNQAVSGGLIGGIIGVIILFLVAGAFLWRQANKNSKAKRDVKLDINSFKDPEPVAREKVNDAALIEKVDFKTSSSSHNSKSESDYFSSPTHSSSTYKVASLSESTSPVESSRASDFARPRTPLRLSIPVSDSHSFNSTRSLQNPHPRPTDQQLYTQYGPNYPDRSQHPQERTQYNGRPHYSDHPNIQYQRPLQTRPNPRYAPHPAQGYNNREMQYPNKRYSQHTSQSSQWDPSDTEEPPNDNHIDNIKARDT